jgi:NAD(P)-dependent dehydrogenase (short-subunit alcohol dehydrogenase family)
LEKKLLIFGSEGALGKGVTKTLLSKNYDQIFLYDFKYNSPSAQKNIKQIVIKDLSIEKNVEEAFREIKSSKNSSYFLFSTIGGFFGGKSVWETDENDFDKMFNMNLKTNFFIAKKFSELVEASNGGSLCFTSAFTSIKPESLKFAYGASKSALNHLVKTLSIEGQKIKLSVNAIAPFIIDTPANREWMKDSDYSGWMKPEEIGQLVHSLFENYNFVSGNIIELKERFDR